MTQAIHYRITPIRPEAHIFEVSCTVTDPDPEGQRFALPAWIPGSYLVRDFARHIVTLRANQGTTGRGGTLAVEKLDKHTWRCEPVVGAITVTCEVYAWDLSVRGAHLDTTHAFFNGTSVFLRVLGKEDRRCDVEIAPPPGARYRRWEVATALKRRRAPQWGFGVYTAADYDELIDHPVEIGSFSRRTFLAKRVPHEIVITGRHRADMDRLARDMKRICETQIDFWNGAARSRRGGASAPMERYVFLITAVGEGYGGLEHRASTALMCSRKDLPTPGMKEPTEAYRGFLGLVSHEYFHTWNVKRIKPAAFTPYDLDRESHTTLLWAFEGLTSYYDDLMLLRSGLLTEEKYLETLAHSITQLMRMPGRQKQSVTDSSFDAWTKYYRQDENSPNAIVSYYGKGSLVGLCLDLHIRNSTGGRKSLDDVMLALWKKHGKTGVGVAEDGVERLAEAVTKLRLKRLFDRWLRSTAELPLADLLASHGVELVLRPAQSEGDKGGLGPVKSASLPDGKKRRAAVVRAVAGVRGTPAAGEFRLTHVLEGSAAQKAGLSAGDAIVAVDGIRVGAGGIDAVLAGRRPGEKLGVHAFRRDELMQFEVLLDAAPADTCVLRMADKSAEDKNREARRLRMRWLS